MNALEILFVFFVISQIDLFTNIIFKPCLTKLAQYTHKKLATTPILPPTDNFILHHRCRSATVEYFRLAHGLKESSIVTRTYEAFIHPIYHASHKTFESACHKTFETFIHPMNCTVYQTRNSFKSLSVPKDSISDKYQYSIQSTLVLFQIMFDVRPDVFMNFNVPDNFSQPLQTEQELYLSINVVCSQFYIVSLTTAFPMSLS